MPKGSTYAEAVPTDAGHVLGIDAVTHETRRFGWDDVGTFVLNRPATTTFVTAIADTSAAAAITADHLTDEDLADFDPVTSADTADELILQTGTGLNLITVGNLDNRWATLTGYTMAGNITLGAHNIVGDTGTGSTILTSASQKLAFFGGTPVVQATSTTDLRTLLVNYGLLASGGASPLNLNGGAFTAASSSLTGASGLSVTDGTASHGSVTVTAGAFGPGVNLKANSGDTQATVSLTTLGGVAFGPGGSTSADIALNRSGALTLSLTDGGKLATGTTTGLTLLTGTTQKLGFFNTTPVVQATSTADLRTTLVNYGLVASGGANPLNLNGGALTAASGAFTGAAGITVTDGTAGDGSAVVTAGVLGPGVSLRANSGDTQAKVSLTTIGGLAFGAGGSSAADISINRTAGLTLSITDGTIIKSTATTTGLTLLSATTEKLGLYGSTPVAQQSSTVDIRTALVNLGVFASGGANPLNLNGGALTAASGSFTGASGVTVTDGTTSHGSTIITAGAFGPGMSLKGDSTDTQAKVSLTTIGGLAFGAGGASAADVAINRSGSITLSITDGAKLASGGTTTGLTILTATTQKLGFYNVTPIVQYATTGTSTGFTAGAGTNVTHLSTFTGNTGSTAYTIGDLVRAGKLYGWLAA